MKVLNLVTQISRVSFQFSSEGIPIRRERRELLAHVSGAASQPLPVGVAMLSRVTAPLIALSGYSNVAFPL